MPYFNSLSDRSSAFDFFASSPAEEEEDNDEFADFTYQPVQEDTALFDLPATLPLLQQPAELPKFEQFYSPASAPASASAPAPRQTQRALPPPQSPGGAFYSSLRPLSKPETAKKEEKNLPHPPAKYIQSAPSGEKAGKKVASEAQMPTGSQVKLLWYCYCYFVTRYAHLTSLSTFRMQMAHGRFSLGLIKF